MCVCVFSRSKQYKMRQFHTTFVIICDPCMSDLVNSARVRIFKSLFLYVLFELSGMLNVDTGTWFSDEDASLSVHALVSRAEH